MREKGAWLIATTLICYERKTMDHGKRAESRVAKLCGDLFLKDFVLEAPKFRTPGGQLREVADALLPHGDVLIAMQVKTRVIPSVDTQNRPVMDS